MTPSEMISQYIALRATRLEMEAEHKAQIAPYKEAEETIELALLEHLNAQGLQNLKSPEGTAYKITKTNVALVDRLALIDHVIQTGNFDYFTNSLSKETVKAYREREGKSPPGVEINEFIEVNIRKA